jgi:hypothetical protein
VAREVGARGVVDSKHNVHVPLGLDERIGTGQELANALQLRSNKSWTYTARNITFLLVLLLQAAASSPAASSTLSSSVRSTIRSSWSPSCSSTNFEILTLRFDTAGLQDASTPTICRDYPNWHLLKLHM